MNDPLILRDVLADEFVQRRETGYDVTPLEVEVAAAVAPGGPDPRPLLHRLAALDRRTDWSYEEPTEEAAIGRATGPAPERRPPPPSDELRDRILAAWFGRAAGCTLGKPIEGLVPRDVERYLAAAGLTTIDDYLPGLPVLPEGIRLLWPEAVRERLEGVPRDDDIDYTILALHVLEDHGRTFTAADVAAEWIDHLPLTRTYTAERAAYRNLAAGLSPPATALVDNPWREWIGAQIRVDAYAYVCPGEPAAAVRLAYADASVSHVGNGIYGAQWVAALIAAAFTAVDMAEALALANSFVPPRSRLAEALGDVCAVHRAGGSWRDAHDEIEAAWGGLSFVHTIQNAAATAAALLWGEGDFTRTIGLAVRGGWDTDCNGATAGSAFGAMHGTSAIASHWLKPLGDTAHSVLADVEAPSLTDLATRTWSLAEAACR